MDNYVLDKKHIDGVVTIKWPAMNAKFTPE